MCDHNINTDIIYDNDNNNEKYYKCEKCKCLITILDNYLLWKIPFDSIDNLYCPTTNTYEKIDNNTYKTILQILNKDTIENIINDIEIHFKLYDIKMKVLDIKKININDKRIDNDLDDNNNCLYEVSFKFDSKFYLPE